MSENLEANQIAIEYCKGLKRDIKSSEENKRPLSVQIESELRKVCKLSFEISLENFPELKAVVDEQKRKEVNGLKIWKKELKKVMKENNLSEKDIEEE